MWKQLLTATLLSAGINLAHATVEALDFNDSVQPSTAKSPFDQLPAEIVQQILRSAYGISLDQIKETYRNCFQLQKDQNPLVEKQQALITTLQPQNQQDLENLSEYKNLQQQIDTLEILFKDNQKKFYKQNVDLSRSLNTLSSICQFWGQLTHNDRYEHLLFSKQHIKNIINMLQEAVNKAQADIVKREELFDQLQIVQPEQYLIDSLNDLKLRIQSTLYTFEKWHADLDALNKSLQAFDRAPSTISLNLLKK